MVLTKNIWRILFILGGLPLTIYRSKFLKIVYQTDKWTISIKPFFNSQTKVTRHVNEALMIIKEF
jgi:hypothetical protein